MVSHFPHCMKMQQWDVFQKHQSQNAIRISERHFFLLESGLNVFSPVLCYANVISSSVTIFISKNVETIFSVVPITFPGMAIPNPIPGTRHGEGVCL